MPPDGILETEAATATDPVRTPRLVLTPIGRQRLGLRHVGTIHREGLVERHPGLHPDAPFALYRR
jgi:hypothetical protein